MRILAIEIRENHAIVAAGGDFPIKFFWVQSPVPDSGDARSTLTKAFSGELLQLIDQADQVLLSIPIRYSLTRAINIDIAGLNKYGESFLTWEANQHLPEELGSFRWGFTELKKSFDEKSVEYLFWACSDSLALKIQQSTGFPESKIVFQSEAVGLLKSLNLASNGSGFCAALKLEMDGASIVIAHDGDFSGARFIKASGQTLTEEIMYYLFGLGSEDLQPRLLLCGDHLNRFQPSDPKWAEILKLDYLKHHVDHEQLIAVYGLVL